MFKHIFLPLIVIASIHASEKTNPGIEWCKTAEIANEVAPTARSIMLIISHLQRGILIMEQDTNKECEEFMRNIATNASIVLVKLMALTKIDRQVEGIKAGLILALYQAYVRFNAKLEANYSQAAASADTAVDATSTTEELPTT